MLLALLGVSIPFSQLMQEERQTTEDCDTHLESACLCGVRAGDRARVTSTATMYSTTRPLIQRISLPVTKTDEGTLEILCTHVCSWLFGLVA